MKKRISFIVVFMMVILLSGCITPALDKLSINLNPGVDTIDIGDTYIDPGANALYGFVEIEVEIKSSNLNTSIEGTYEIVYLATYKSISKELKRIVTVVDQSPPVLTLNPGIDTVILGETWMDAFVVVTDNSGLEVTIEVLGTVDESTKGTYEITYVATDHKGLESRITRYVEVIDLNDYIVE